MRTTLCTDKKAHDLLGWEPKEDLLDFVRDFVNNQK